MAAFTSIKTNDSKRINRIINADLVIDEIDSFNYEDLSALTILIYIAGVFGRKVLLSSATINPYLAKAYQHIYMQGYQQFCRIYQINNLEIKYFFGLFNEFPDCCIVETCSSNNFVSKFSNSIDSYYHKTIKNLDKCIPKRKVGFMDVLPKNFKPGIEENIQYVCKKVSNKISQLHNDFHESQNKKNISIGLIRVANTTNGFYFFENLVNCYNGKKEEVQKRKRLFLFYHSKLSANSLKIVEDELNELLKRKNSKKIWKNKIIRKILKKYPDVSDFEIVIVATPIEEVGRDHDFDWCILEPVSVWSLIQIIGRIMRHREFNIKEHRSPNVVILSHDLKYLFCGKKGQSYQKPGPNIKNNLDITRSAQDLFPVEIRDMADSRYCFYINKEEIETNTKNKINALEFFNFKNGIYDNFCKNENIFNELNTYTTHKFDVVYPFRKQHMFDLFCEEKDKEIKIKGRYGKNYFFDREILNNFINGKEGIFLNPYMSSDFFNEKISQRLQVYITKSQSFFIYHPYFGFIQKKDMFWL
jgi:CRISPR/Cas system-associated endonuclease/helicase Cas3